MVVEDMVVQDNEIINRAIRAYWLAARKQGVSADIPGNISGIFEDDGKRYVALRNGRGVLALYRVRNDGLLKRLRRWPAGLIEQCLRSV